MDSHKKEDQIYEEFTLILRTLLSQHITLMRMFSSKMVLLLHLLGPAPNVVMEDYFGGTRTKI